MLESIETLREWSHWLDCAYATSIGDSYRIYDAPLVDGMKSCGLLIREKCDEIEREIAELQESWAQEAREHADDSARLAELARENAELKREIAERYMELPVDADGVPIHVGDELCGYGLPDGGAIVKALNSTMVIVGRLEGGENYAKSGLLWSANETRHYKQRIEDLLERFIEDYDHWDEFAHFGRDKSKNALFARYADEIRKAAGE